MGLENKTNAFEFKTCMVSLFKFAYTQHNNKNGNWVRMVATIDNRNKGGYDMEACQLPSSYIKLHRLSKKLNQ